MLSLLLHFHIIRYCTVLFLSHLKSFLPFAYFTTSIYSFFKFFSPKLAGMKAYSIRQAWVFVLWLSLLPPPGFLELKRQLGMSSLLARNFYFIYCNMYFDKRWASDLLGPQIANLQILGLIPLSQISKCLSPCQSASRKFANLYKILHDSLKTVLKVVF
jgi:hypothetical protein